MDLSRTPPGGMPPLVLPLAVSKKIYFRDTDGPTVDAGFSVSKKSAFLLLTRILKSPRTSSTPRGKGDTDMTGQTIAYRRVSTTDQVTDRQLPDMAFDREFSDQCSGSSTNRPGLKACLDFIRDGDTLVVHSMDRLARNLPDMLALVGDLTKRGVTLKFHKEGLTFTGEKNPMQDLQLAIMGAVAQFELAMIRERQKEGVAAAKKAGKHCGRKATLTEEQTREVIARAEAGADKSKLAGEFGISRATIYNVIERAKTGK